MMALVKTVVNSAATVAATKASKDQRDQRSGRGGRRQPQRGEARDEEQREGGDPGLAPAAPVGERAEKRAADGDEDAGGGGGVAPQRLAAGAIADDGVGEVGREQEGEDQRVVGLGRPVEQHPRDEGAHAARLRSRAGAPFCVTGAAPAGSGSCMVASPSGRCPGLFC